MRSFNLVSPSRPDNAKAAAVGEVLNGRYVVKAVEQDENGRAQYKCVALRGHQEVLVRLAARKDHNVDITTGLLSANEPESVEATGDEDSGYLDRFELRFGRDRHIYVVLADGLNAFTASSSADRQRNVHEHQSLVPDIEDPRPDMIPPPIDGQGNNDGSFEEPERRQGPLGSRILIYKRGDDNLEVDIPSYGARIESAFLIVFTTGWLGFIFFWTFFIVAISIAASDPMALIMVPFSLPFWMIGFLMLTYVIRSNFTHENLTITPMNFRIKRTIEFRRRHRDSVINAVRANAQLSCMDRLFCKQRDGATRDLTAAITRRSLVGKEHNLEYVVLVEGLKEHTLCNNLTEEEKDWLLSEINDTLPKISESRAALREQEQATVDT